MTARMISIINMASNLDDLNIANVSKEWLDLQWNQIMQRTYIDLIKGKVQIKDQTGQETLKKARDVVDSSRPCL